MKAIFTVTELTRNIQSLLESNFALLWIEGEISNLRRPASGHIYFTLKDDKSQIRAVVFRQALRSLKFGLEDGMQIVCRASLNVYEQRGEYQLIIDLVEPKGLGALQAAFEQLKARLQAEGLFDAARKRPIPFLAGRIAVVTSPSGAVIRDILTITARRFPSTHILIAPVRVQGAEAAGEIIQALEQVNGVPDIDVIVLARGGGSLEDLAPFNDEGVARAICCSKIPVVSAVGHEVDFTIADFVADLRAPTPSAAAELVVPLRRELEASVSELKARLFRYMDRVIDGYRDDLSSLGERMKHPGKRISDYCIQLDAETERLRSVLLKRLELARRDVAARKQNLMVFNLREKIKTRRLSLESASKDLAQSLTHRVNTLKQRLDHAIGLLDNLSPLAVLKRGYSIVRMFPDGPILRQAESVSPGSLIEVRLSSGELTAEVRDILKRG